LIIYNGSEHIEYINTRPERAGNAAGAAPRGSAAEKPRALGEV